MSRDERGQKKGYEMVVDGGGAFIIWPRDYDVPLDLKATGQTGTRQECLGYLLEAATGGEQHTGGDSQAFAADRDDQRPDQTIYKVIVNHEDQYSIWPADRENALGWNDAGKSGSKKECLAYIEEVWTDMRPLSLRKKE